MLRVTDSSSIAVQVSTMPLPTTFAKPRTCFLPSWQTATLVSGPGLLSGKSTGARMSRQMIGSSSLSTCLSISSGTLSSRWTKTFRVRKFPSKTQARSQTRVLNPIRTLHLQKQRSPARKHVSCQVLMRTLRWESNTSSRGRITMGEISGGLTRLKY